MKDIYWLSQIQYAEQALVGNKLFILSQLLQDGYPIVPGFVLGNNLWRKFLQLIDASLLTTNDQDYRSRQAFARNSRQIIQQTTIPQIWQTEIFQAAQQLNSPGLILQPFVTTPDHHKIRENTLWRSHTCNCNGEALNTALKSVWSELFSASSLIYWQKLGLSYDLIDLAVLVRPIKSAYASGTVEISDDFIEIKANWGLEYSLLQGDTEADEYYLDRDLKQIISQHLGQKNYAYRAKNVSLSAPLDECLEAYLPADHLAATYVLDPKAIAQLIELTQNILEQQSEIKYIVWNAFNSSLNANAPLHFYCTQLSDLLISHSAIADKIVQNLSLPKIAPLLSGMAVSPGTIQAEIAVIPDLIHLPPIAPGSILVTKVIDPQHVSLIKQVKGIITEIGGRNSHAAIVARELGIPAIANASNASKILHHGDRILLNGDDGRVYPATDDYQVSSPALKGILSPTYPIATKLMVNLAQPESIAGASKLPIDGVGLLRSELMMTDLFSSQVLAQWQESFQRQLVSTLCNYLRQFAVAFFPRPVFYRSLDLSGQNSLNPVLGDRGVYRYISDPTLFDLELEALQTIAAEGHHNINLILPFVRSVDEFKFCYHRLENIGLTIQDSFQVWIMAEVPSVIMLLPEYIRAGVQGIAIGTNDLTQLLLGVDRERNQFSDRGLNANHPAMHKAIAQLIKTAHDYDLECCICGQAPVEHPDLIDKLVQWGIDIISVEPDAIAQTYKAIARAEKRMILDERRN
ncbi:peptide chain release factor H [Pleurocapsa sp. CCALA 161]|uniref:putative PEP-binding protein n=1 Tax=Pleurocapsa sp. CCALA 161 TaxID=2107688 RepID=UPI000D04E1F4|nr:putative PEP-binding protein [Pleurocapsa sp. CCALA 161]PSB11179.1 peptide chain release factor H [Pleurocapsa sp. CCALA 161]